MKPCMECIRGTTHLHRAPCGAKHDWRCCTQDEGWMPCGIEAERKVA